MADVLFAEYLKILIILNRLHKQNQEILRVHTPILHPSSHNKVVSLTTFFTFLQDLKEQPYPQTMFTFGEIFASLAPFMNFMEKFASLAPFFTAAVVIVLTPCVTAAVVIVLSPCVKEYIPLAVSDYLVSMYEKWLSRFSTPQVTVVIEEKGNLKISNQIYEAARAYLQTLISNSTKPIPKRFKVNKEDMQNGSTIDIVDDEEVIDIFNGIRLKWKLHVAKGFDHRILDRYLELSFDKGIENLVLESYLPSIVERYKSIRNDNNGVKLYTRDNGSCRSGSRDEDGQWISVVLKHPITFEKLAMDPKQKEMLMDDLNTFLGRKDLYENVGKTWKRGYLLYGPAGTGKSSLIAAMANYLKFDIYDLNLSGGYSDEDLSSILLSTTNRSILVIDEDRRPSVSILYSHKILF